MKTTNWKQAEELRNSIPKTFLALQKLFLSMDKVQKNSGKKNFLGKDKGIKYYDKFKIRLTDTLHAMITDELISDSSPEDEVVIAVHELINMFYETFPNWQSAYEFSEWYFTVNTNAAIHEVKISLACYSVYKKFEYLK